MKKRMSIIESNDKKKKEKKKLWRGRKRRRVVNKKVEKATTTMRMKTEKHRKKNILRVISFRLTVIDLCFPKGTIRESRKLRLIKDGDISSLFFSRRCVKKERRFEITYMLLSAFLLYLKLSLHRSLPLRRSTFFNKQEWRIQRISTCILCIKGSYINSI